MAIDDVKGVEPSGDTLSKFQFDDVAEMPAAKSEPVFGIRLNNFGLLVSTAIYCEVLDKVAVNPLPNVHPWVNGILNLRGNFVPVFDLHLILKQTVADSQKRRLFTIDRGDKAVAIWIDNFPEIVDKSTFKVTKMLPDLPQVVQRSLKGCYQQAEQLWLDVKLDELFSVLGRHQFQSEEMVR